MNQKRAQELLPIIQAFAEGKDIQIQTKVGDWLYIPDPMFNSDDEYRVKPERLMLYANLRADHDGTITLHKTKEAAEFSARNSMACYADIAIKMIQAE